jgi:hypothetical protein
MPSPKRKFSEMHRAKNFHPEWGRVAGANSFRRTIQIVVVATAIGATAGGGVVLSLVDFPTGQTSLAAHTLVAPVQTAMSAPVQPNPQAIVKSEIALQVSGHAEAAASDLSANPNNLEPVNIAPLAEVGPNGAQVNVATAPRPGGAPVENKAGKKHHVVTRYPPRDRLFGFVQGERYMNGNFGGSYRDVRWGGFYQNGSDRHHAWW